MPQKRYIVRLTAQGREVCRETVRKLNGSSEKVRRAQALAVPVSAVVALFKTAAADDSNAFKGERAYDSKPST